MIQEFKGQRLTSEILRQHELSSMTRDQLQQWVLSQFHAALERESSRAVHAARLDDCISSIFKRLYQILEHNKLDKVLRDQIERCIVYHHKVWEQASEPVIKPPPRSGS